MLASSQSWNPNIPMNISMLRKAPGSRGKVEWNEELEADYQAVLKIMKNQIRLSLYDPPKKLRLLNGWCENSRNWIPTISVYQ